MSFLGGNRNNDPLDSVIHLLREYLETMKIMNERINLLSERLDFIENHLFSEDKNNVDPEKNV